MPPHADIDLVVFDVLGTLVNEPGGLHRSIRELAPTSSAGQLDDLVEVWLSHVADQQRTMLEGRRPYAYRLALDIAGGGPPERVLMVAAHAWDLRGAQALGLRTAHVQRPVGDPPLATDSFDHHTGSLADLVAELLDRRPR
jgi:phosphoglycolate phosphatase-like HAD superfamily hydrolase